MGKSVDTSDMKFEKALQALENIVERFNSGMVDLEESMHLYEEGLHYLKICLKKLAEAEIKVNEFTERMNKELAEEEKNG